MVAKKKAAKRKPRTAAKKTTTRKKATKRPASKKAASKKALKPVITESDLPEKSVFLDVPWDERTVASNRGATYYGGDVRAWVFDKSSGAVPLLLQSYMPEQFSWLAWKQYRVTGDTSLVMAEQRDQEIKIRDYQERISQEMSEAYDMGAPMYLLNHGTGVGKTYTSIEFLKKVASRPLNVLIIAPLGVHEQWRRSLRDMGTADKRVCIINYESLKQLLTVPPAAAAAKRMRTKNKQIADNGKPIQDWDIVICDESQKLRNPEALQTKAYFTLRRGGFTVHSTATPGQTPSELVYLSDILEYRSTGICRWDEKKYHVYAQQLGLAVDKNDYGSLSVKWEENDEDLKALHQILFQQSPSMGDALDSSSIPGWPELQRIPFPIKLTTAEQASYDQLWTDFQEEHDLARRGKNPVNGLAAQLRFRQKTSILRVPYVVSRIEDLLEQGFQVPVSVEFRESTEKMSELLTKHKIGHVIINGDHTAKEKEENRLRFQRGDVKVIIYSVKEGISLHANETAVKGTSTRRAGIIADPMWSGIATKQVEGRQHRNGENAPIYHSFISDTIDEKVVLATVSRLDNLNELSGIDESSIQEAFESFLS